MRTVPLSHAAEVTLGRQRAPQYEEGEGQTPYLRSANISDGRLNLADVKSMRFSPSERQHFGLRPGDVLVTEGSGSRDTVGASAVWSSELDGPVCFQNTLLRLRPREGVDGRYLGWWARHAHASGLIAAVASGANILHIGAQSMRALPVLLPDDERQRGIVRLLDRQVVVIDDALEQTAAQVSSLDRRSVLAAGERLIGPRGGWVVEGGWRLAPVGSFFHLDLGKMLNEERAAGGRPRAYLRNTNVQWDRIDTDDLKEMHFEAGETRRYGLRKGDLLICEGGQPGRAAMWDGRVPEMYFQKALHRARPRREDVSPRWLLHLLRVCVHRGAFADESGTTIAHLTGEQLRELRLPFPPLEEQRVLVAQFDDEWSRAAEAREHALALGRLLEERKRALITACVTGEFDISTASSRAGNAALAGLPKIG